MEVSEEFRGFWRERHLCTVTTLRRDGSPHVVPMGIVLDVESGVAWGITSRTSQKTRNLARADPGTAAARVAVCSVDGRRWSTLEGVGEVLADPASVGEAERRYAERYRVPRENPSRVALRIAVDRTLGNL